MTKLAILFFVFFVTFKLMCANYLLVKIEDGRRPGKLCKIIQFPLCYVMNKRLLTYIKQFYIEIF
jgi:hypothetical protein